MADEADAAVEQVEAELRQLRARYEASLVEVASLRDENAPRA